MHKKWLNVFSFFTGNFIVNFLVSILCLIFVDTKAFIICFLSLGYFISLLFRELYPNKKTEYLFYYNNGITKTELIAYCFLLNMAFITLFTILLLCTF